MKITMTEQEILDKIARMKLIKCDFDVHMEALCDLIIECGKDPWDYLYGARNLQRLVNDRVDYLRIQLAEIRGE